MKGFVTSFLERNWVFATNSVFVKSTSLQPYDVNLWYFKLTLFDLIAVIVWNIKGLRHRVATILKLENQSLWQKLNSFVCLSVFNKHKNGSTDRLWQLPWHQHYNLNMRKIFIFSVLPVQLCDILTSLVFFTPKIQDTKLV